MQFRLVLIPAMIIVGAAACGSSTSPGGGGGTHVDGTTQGWFNGSTVTLSYTREFACPMPPAAHSTSGCEAGAPPSASPSSGKYATGSVPPIYFLVPLYTPGPPAATLQCPIPGNCVDHPMDIDLGTYLGAVFGAGDTMAVTPAHSHVITTLAGGANIPWLGFVVGVRDSTTWNALVAAKDSAEITTLQNADPTLNTPGSGGVGTHITTYIPTNLFLYFEATSP
jgi:hypothetical protein